MAIISFVFKVIFFIISLVMFIPAKIAYFDGADQKTWLATPAKVLKSELGVRKADDKAKLNKKNNEDEGFKITLEDTYFWNVEYEYVYDGISQKREGIYVNLKSSDGNKDRYLTRAKQHPVGSKITVYVNPEDSSQAYIDRRTEGGIESWYNITRVMFYLSIFLFFTPLIKFIYKEMKGTRKPQQVQNQENAQSSFRQNYSQPRSSTTTSQEQSKASKYSDDGFDT